jgi:hypothetical protein
MNVFRINKFSLIRFYEDVKIGEYFSTVWTKTADDTPFNQFVINDDPAIDRTVWFDGTYYHRLNKVYSSTDLYDPRATNDIVLEGQVTTLSLMVIQGFTWFDLFGLLLVVKKVDSDDILLSQMLYLNDFKLTEEKELINGAFWLEEALIKLPFTSDTLEVEVIRVTYDDIVNDGPKLGLVYNYPKELIQLIPEKPIPDYIQTNISLDLNNFLYIQPVTSELKTLEQSILDYFKLSIAEIEIKHIIKYGVESLGFKTISLTNEDNKFGPLRIGLDLSEFATPENDDCIIFVSTEILVEGKLMKRENQIQTKLMEVLNPLIDGKIVLPTIKYPVNIEVQNIVNQQIIEAKEKLKTVVIYQPLFAQFIQSEFKIENKNIFFDSVVNPAVLVVGDKPEKLQELLNEKTIDNKYYFDLSKLKPIDEETVYQLIDVNSEHIIGEGKVLL